MFDSSVTSRERSVKKSPFVILLLVSVFMTAQLAITSPAYAGPSYRGKFSGIELYHPYGLAFDPDDPDGKTVFVADTSNHRIVKYVDGVAKSYFGTGPPTFEDGTPEDGKLYYPAAVSVFNGEVYVADQANSRVQVFGASDGAFHRGFGQEGSGPGDLNSPSGIAVNEYTGVVGVVDQRNYRVATFDLNGKFIKNFGKQGSGSGEFIRPSGIAYNPATAAFFVTDGYNGIFRVEVWSSNGIFSFEFGSYGTERGQINFPDQIAADGEGNVYIANSGDNRIQKFSYEGNLIWEITGPSSEAHFSYPHGVAADKLGNFVVTSTNESAVYWFKDRPPGVTFNPWGLDKFDYEFQVRYFIVGQTCEGSIRSTFSFAGKVIKASKHTEFSDASDFKRTGLEHDEFQAIKAADKAGKKIAGESTLRAKCSDGEVVSKSVKFKV